MSLVRTFIGVHLEEALLAKLEELTNDLRRRPGGQAARWVPKGNIHLTLKFLGEVESERLPAIHDAVARVAAGARPFALEVAGLGCFPSTRRPNIVWVGLRGDLEALRALQSATERALKPLGFKPEGRPFSPHLTIGRVNRKAAPGEVAALGATIASWEPVPLGTWRVEAVSVIRSDLRPAGPLYTDLSVAPLGLSQSDTPAR